MKHRSNFPPTMYRNARLAEERGIRQLIDIGAGLPTQRSTHEVARSVISDSRVVYTDSDPQVVARGHDILAGVTVVTVIQVDLHTQPTITEPPDSRDLT